MQLSYQDSDMERIKYYKLDEEMKYEFTLAETQARSLAQHSLTLTSRALPYAASAQHHQRYSIQS